MLNIFEEDSLHLINKLELPNLEGVRILLTGSSGLIGTNLLNFLNTLLMGGKFAFDVDALSMGTREDQIKYHQNIHFQTGDLSLGVREFSLQKYNYIIHAATYGQ